MDRRRSKLTASERLQNMINVASGVENATTSNNGNTIEDEEEEDAVEYKPPVTRKRRRVRSKIWSLFDFDNAYYYCTLCPSHTSFKRPPSTTVALRHIRRFHIENLRVRRLMLMDAEFCAMIDVNRQQSPESTAATTSEQPATPSASMTVAAAAIAAIGDTSKTRSTTTAIEAKKPKQIQIESLFVKFVSLPELPLSIVASDELSALFTCLNSRFSLPADLRSVKGLLFEHAAETRALVRAEIAAFKGAISATIGIWAYQPRNYAYISVTLHFVSANMLQRRFLGVRRRKNLSVESCYRAMLTLYGLTKDDIYRTFISERSDGACSFATSSVDDEDTEFEEHASLQMSSIDEHIITVKEEENHLEDLREVELDTSAVEENAAPSADAVDGGYRLCVAYELRAILSSVLSETLAQSHAYKRMLGIFEKFQQSQTAMLSLASSIACTFTRLVANDWKTWLELLDFYKHHHNLISQIAIQHNWEVLSDEENKLLYEYLDILSVFRSSIKTLEANKSPCVSWVYGIVRAVKSKVGEQKRANAAISHMCELYAEELDARLAYVQDDPIYQIATYLDPETRPHLKTDDADKAIELIADWLKIDEETLIPPSADTNNPADPLLKMLDSFGTPSSTKKTLVRSFADAVNDRYLKQADRGKFSATTLKCINEVAKEQRFHGIAQISRVVLAVPVSNALNEDAFFTLLENVKSSDPNARVLDAKLLIHLNQNI